MEYDTLSSFVSILKNGKLIPLPYIILAISSLIPLKRRFDYLFIVKAFFYYSQIELIVHVISQNLQFIHKQAGCIIFTTLSKARKTKPLKRLEKGDDSKK